MNNFLLGLGSGILLGSCLGVIFLAIIIGGKE
jgi:hypothetical protein